MADKQPNEARTNYAKMNSELSNANVEKPSVMQSVEIDGNVDTLDISNKDNYILNFKSKLTDHTERSCRGARDDICNCCCNLLVASYFWVIYFMIICSYNIYIWQIILNTLNYNCSVVDLYVDQTDICIQQVSYITIGLNVTIIYAFIIVESMGLVSSLFTFVGIHRCVPRLILLQIICIVLIVGVEIYMYIKAIFRMQLDHDAIKWTTMFTIAFRFYPIYVFYRVYKWAKYYKNGGEHVSESDIEY